MEKRYYIEQSYVGPSDYYVIDSVTKKVVVVATYTYCYYIAKRLNESGFCIETVLNEVISDMLIKKEMEKGV